MVVLHCGECSIVSVRQAFAVVLGWIPSVCHYKLGLEDALYSFYYLVMLVSLRPKHGRR